MEQLVSDPQTITPDTMTVFKAFKQCIESYNEMSIPIYYDMNTIAEDNIKAIDAYIKRPAEEKHMLMIVAALIASAPVFVKKEMPENIAEYGDQVKTIVEDHLHPYHTVNRDCMQLYLVSIITTINRAIEILENGEKTRKEQKNVITLFENGIKSMRADLTHYSTGEQPRLESKAKESIERAVSAIEQEKQIANTSKPDKKSSLTL